MENRTREIVSNKHKHVKLGIIPGHFATNHSHVNYYVDLNKMKRKMKNAREAAMELDTIYSGTPIDTIVCLEGTQMIGAFLAENLSNGSTHSINYGNDMCVITPELDSNNQMIFRDDTQPMIWNKRVLLLISSASTGWTINRFMECIKYYSGNLVGVAALFSAIKEVDGLKVSSLFSTEDIPGYESHSPAECPMCKEKLKVDALINAYGYSKI
ncbi:MAG: orotate phosphoribosyltransferase [Firmicutes bacterium]|nr:orotate phosphoribosyltransferase [[Eubacterium] siraeum]MCM1488446.1 orotate phosphoribosyltransferase [Bacillota bacterium]